MKKEVLSIERSKLLEQREQIQNDLLCLLDGLDQDYLDKACEIIVDRFEILLEQYQQKILNFIGSFHRFISCVNRIPRVIGLLY